MECTGIKYTHRVVQPLALCFHSKQKLCTRSSSSCPPPAPGTLCSGPMNLTSQVPHRSGIKYLSFSDWLTSLGIKASRFTHVIAGVRTSFLFMVHEIPSCLCNTFCLSIHLRMDKGLSFGCRECRSERRLYRYLSSCFPVSWVCAYV